MCNRTTAYKHLGRPVDVELTDGACRTGIITALDGPAIRFASCGTSQLPDGTPAYFAADDGVGLALAQIARVRPTVLQS